MDYHIIFIDKMQVAPPQNSWLLLTTVGPQYLTFRNQKIEYPVRFNERHTQFHWYFDFGLAPISILTLP
ncbi:hypothetical protein EFM25_05520 [Lactiplantibacillus plantarum]|nr:hypothetical protein CXP42_11410 [Lactiplantibacillus plantarum subsp. plantarum]MCT1224065.1 hypothetical protein [Lactiplantibacillus plantarum]MCT3227737.1 hypothetical protein [Lactiplantibacillus plantarum]MCT3244475.1 hypothetical protein [Lactiplantibacillus plantarum]NFA49091.1 hypothetical protein [Lactiplantibacillus plantarum]